MEHPSLSGAVPAQYGGLPVTISDLLPRPQRPPFGPSRRVEPSLLATKNGSEPSHCDDRTLRFSRRGKAAPRPNRRSRGAKEPERLSSCGRGKPPDRRQGTCERSARGGRRRRVLHVIAPVHGVDSLQLASRAHLELAVGAKKVAFDGLLGEKQGAGDLRVRVTTRRQLTTRRSLEVSASAPESASRRGRVPCSGEVRRPPWRSTGPPHCEVRGRLRAAERPRGRRGGAFFSKDSSEIDEGARQCEAEPAEPSSNRTACFQYSRCLPASPTTRRHATPIRPPSCAVVQRASSRFSAARWTASSSRSNADNDARSRPATR